MDKFRVLTVCAGNICRSPLAERLLRPSCAAASCGGHLSGRVTEELIGEADLVLTATREHRAAVVRLLPRSSRRTASDLADSGAAGSP